MLRQNKRALGEQYKSLQGEMKHLETQQKQNYKNLSEVALNVERAQARAAGVVQQLEEMGLNIPSSEEKVTIEPSEQAKMKASLAEIEEKIKNLGAVNLVST